MMGQGVTVQGWKVRICPTTEPPKTWGFFCLSRRVGTRAFGRITRTRDRACASQRRA